MWPRYNLNDTHPLQIVLEFEFTCIRCRLRIHKRLCAATPNIIPTNQQPGGVFAARSRFEHDASPSSVVGWRCWHKFYLTLASRVELLFSRPHGGLRSKHRHVAKIWRGKIYITIRQIDKSIDKLTPTDKQTDSLCSYQLICQIWTSYFN